ncbi:MAG: hypothetical protein GX765_00195 [Candidatus Moranbacteria bacterium]|nr:hypothetical protein [Candidatus Moranbacteria bacterium]
MEKNKHKKTFILSGLFFIISFLIFPNISEAATSVSQYGITWNFDGDYPVGQYANGDYWVLGPVRIISITPDFDGSHHGWMVNMSGLSQGYDSRSSGFNASLVPSLPYSAQPGDAIIKAVSTEPFDISPRPVLKTTAVLTVVGNIPPDNGRSVFRPSFFGTDRTMHLIDEINPALLPSITPPVGVTGPSLDWVKTRFKMMQLDIDSCCSSENLRAVDNFCEGAASHACSYGGRVALDNGDGALRLMLNDSYEEKEEALIYYIQFGLDLYYQMKQGIKWYPNGGHGSGRKLPIIFAGILLENEEIKNAVKSVTKEAGDSSIFQEDGFLYRGYNNTSLFGSGGNYWTNVVTDYDSRTSKDPYGYIDGGHVPGTSYQEGINSMIWKGPVMAIKFMPEAEIIWDNRLFEEYVNRWVYYGAWAQPDPCAPVMGYCIGGSNPGRVCTYADHSVCGTGGKCAGGICPSGDYAGQPCGAGVGPDGAGGCGGVRCTNYGADFWQVTFGPDPDNLGDCIRDLDPSDGIGRFPAENALRANSGTYQSGFVNALWDEYYEDYQISIPPANPTNLTVF